jgi:hypothetical protein
MSHPATRRALAKPIRTVVLPAPTEVNSTKKKKVFISPGTIHLAYPNKAKTIVWANNTGAAVNIWLVNVQDVFFALQGEDLSQPQKIDDGKEFAVGVEDNVPSLYLKDYQVYCEAIDDYADGDSSPHVGCP